MIEKKSNSHCILKRSHPREQSVVTTKVVKITGQGREATNFPYLDYGHYFQDDDGGGGDEHDHDDERDHDDNGCVSNEFGTRWKSEGHFWRDCHSSWVQFCRTHVSSSSLF